MAIRERLPFPLFIVVLVIVLMLAGFACACLTGHPEQALDRAFVAIAGPPEPFVPAAFAAVTTLVATALVLPQLPARARLQNFRL